LGIFGLAHEEDNMSAIGSILGVAKYVPASTIVGLLSKLNPKFKNYFSDVASYGLDTNRAINFLVDKFSGSDYQNELEQRQGNLRPDEQVAQSEIENSQIPRNIATSLASFGAGGLLGNRSQPPQQPIEASGQNAAQPTQEQAAPQQQTPQAKPTLVLSDAIVKIFNEFPQLKNFLDKQFSSGKTHNEASMLAKGHKMLAPIIKRIENEYSTDFAQILKSVFGEQESQAIQPQGLSPAQQHFMDQIQATKLRRGKGK
jgi:hypothetical protein